jgi:LPS sulfotransferase NodH
MTCSHVDSAGPSIRLSYVICATPRSGSSLLCEALQSTGVAGRPDEYFWHPPFWQEQWDIPKVESYVGDVRRKGTTPNGVFGVKLMWHYFNDLLPRLAAVADLPEADPAAIVSATFPNPRYLWLTRRDKVRQGISWYRALKSNAWRSSDPHAGPEAEPAFNYLEIEELVEQAVKGDLSWQAYFQRHRIEPLMLTYEDFASAPENAALEILRHLDLPPPPPTAPWPPVWGHQRQSDGRTDDWVRQYHAHPS